MGAGLRRQVAFAGVEGRRGAGGGGGGVTDMARIIFW